MKEQLLQDLKEAMKNKDTLMKDTITMLRAAILQVEKDIGNNLPFANVKEFFIFNGYTEDEYDQFEAIRKKESKYYQGTQY